MRKYSKFYDEGSRLVRKFMKQIYKDRPAGSEFLYYPNPMNGNWCVSVKTVRHWLETFYSEVSGGIVLKTEVQLQEDLVTDTETIPKGTLIVITNRHPEW